MPRPQIHETYIVKIADLMQNSGIKRAPVMTEVIETWAQENGWDDYPAERTVQRWMKKISCGYIGVFSKLRKFNWPDSMGEEQDKIPWELSRISLDCLKFYLSENLGRPSVGVVLWYTRVSQADPELLNDQIALMAEKFWAAELLQQIEGHTKPSTQQEEMALTFQTWKKGAPTLDEVLEDGDVKKFWIPKKSFRYVVHMPLFFRELKASKEFEEIEPNEN